MLTETEFINEQFEDVENVKHVFINENKLTTDPPKSIIIPEQTAYDDGRNFINIKVTSRVYLNDNDRISWVTRIKTNFKTTDEKAFYFLFKIYKSNGDHIHTAKVKTPLYCDDPYFILRIFETVPPGTYKKAGRMGLSFEGNPGSC